MFKNLNKEFKTPIKSINYLVEMIKEKHSSLSIFLSTDSHEVEKKFKIEFKDKLLIYPKETNNKGNNKRGIHMWGMDNKNDTYKREMLRFSIIDMWLLSKCKFLIFQSNSSFSLFSKYLIVKIKILWLVREGVNIIYKIISLRLWGRIHL